MPELPEVESLRRILARSATGRTIVRATITEARLRRAIAPELATEIAGRTIMKLDRRAKYLILELSGGLAMLVHLGMSGSLTHRDAAFDSGSFDPRHDHVAFEFDDGTHLVYNDPRRFGLMKLVALDAIPALAELSAIGPEPLGGDFNARYLADMARSKRVAIKNLIMDQRVVAGIGNIYAAEILFRAAVRPTRRAGRVTRAELERIVAATGPILKAAIGSRGTTFRSYRDSRGQPGRFAERLMVYGREDKPCLVCATPIRNVTIGNRASFFCPNCQP